MINSVNSYSSNLYSRANNGLLNKLTETETNKDSISNMMHLNKATESSTFSSSRSSLTLEELLGEMQQTEQKPLSTSSETDSDTLSNDISSVDADGDGTISADEYDTLMSQMGITDSASAEDFFAQYDTNADGEITSTEMDASKPMRPMKPMGPPPEKMQTAVSSLDTDGDGTVSTEEYEAAVTELGIEDTDATDALFAKYDTDSNGIITSDELQAQQSTTDDSTNSTLDEFNKVATQVLATYEENYQYMFETENSSLNSFV